jgi:hypothetical protein
MMHSLKDASSEQIRGNEYVKERATDPVLAEYIGQEQAAEAIAGQIEFTRTYEHLGVRAPVWRDVEKSILRAASDLNFGQGRLPVTTGGISIFAAPFLRQP